MLELHRNQWNDLVRLLQKGSQTYVLLGDRGIGKRTIVRQLVERLGAKLVEFDKFRVDDARQLRQDCNRVLFQSHVFLINGDDSTEQALNAILKLLEEPPRRCAFFISASVAPLSTICSRCHMVLFPRLSDDELLEVLRTKGMTPATALSLIPFAAGSVEGAYKAYKDQEMRRQYVRYFQALQTRDEKFIFEQVRKVTRNDISLLLDLADELLMSRYGLRYSDGTFSAVPQFIQTVKKSLLSGSIPAVGLMRAWIATK